MRTVGTRLSEKKEDLKNFTVGLLTLSVSGSKIEEENRGHEEKP